MMVREFVFGMPAGSIPQANVNEQTWEAILVYEGPTPPPPPSKFPWWLVGVGAVAAVAIGRRSLMKKKKHS